MKKKEILKGILGHCTDRVFIESPVHMSYGNHVHLGDQFYANFNLVIIDDMDVYIGNQVMIGPNVTIERWVHIIRCLSTLAIRSGSEQILLCSRG